METSIQTESVTFRSLGDAIAGVLYLPAGAGPFPALIICHGALEHKEPYFELCKYLASRGVAALAVDMHGHGESAGERYHVDMREWVADIRAAVSLLQEHTSIRSRGIGAFGLSSGATAILEAALVEPRLHALISLDATVRNTMDFVDNLVFQTLTLTGKIKQALTGHDLQVSVKRMLHGARVAVDEEANRRFLSDQHFLEGLKHFPFPGAAPSWSVDTIRRVSRITAPTLVVHGAEDQVEPPETARMLYEALTCEKALCVIPGNGHIGHLDRRRDKVMKLTADWALQYLR